MTDKEPTKEQIIELWEWCGLRWFWNHSPNCNCGAVDNNDSARSWHYFDGKEWLLATQFYHQEMAVDLNNLFKYAVPKLDSLTDINIYRRGEVWKTDLIFYDIPSVRGVNSDPALALFWAIWEVIKQ